MIIYKVTNKINGKIYIGQTIKSLAERWGQHCRSKKNTFFSRAIQKYGKENFTVEQIDVACDRDELDKKEQYWIAYFDSMNPQKGYNLTSGGFTNKHISDDVKKRISQSEKGKIVSAETRLKISISGKGKHKERLGVKVSESTKKKLSELNKGERHPQYGTKKTQAVKHKIKQAVKNLWESKEFKDKVIQGFIRKNPKLGLSVLCVEINKKFANVILAARYMKRTNRSIILACENQSKKSGGYHWRYCK